MCTLNNNVDRKHTMTHKPVSLSIASKSKSRKHPSNDLGTKNKHARKKKYTVYYKVTYKYRLGPGEPGMCRRLGGRVVIPGPLSKHIDSETELKGCLHICAQAVPSGWHLYSPYPPNKLLFICFDAHGGIISFVRFSPGTSSNRGTPYSAHPQPP